MWKVIVGAALLVSVASAYNLTDINRQTDAAIPGMNKYLTSQGLGLFQFGAMSDEDTQLGPGVQIGLNTLERRGDCLVTDFGNSSKYVDFRLGFKLFVLGYGEIHLQGASMAGLFKVNKNVGRVSYWIHDGENCRVELDRYEITELDNATLISSEPKFDGMDVSPLFREYGRGKINQNMLSQRQVVQNYLQNEICNHHCESAQESSIRILHKYL